MQNRYSLVDVSMSSLFTLLKSTCRKTESGNQDTQFGICSPPSFGRAPAGSFKLGVSLKARAMRVHRSGKPILS